MSYTPPPELKTNNAVVPGASNIGTLPAVANAAAPVRSEGFQGSLRTTLAGDLAVTLDGEAIVLGAVPAAGQSATGAAVPAGATMSGLRAATANPTNATGGNLVAAMADKAGRIVTTPVQVRELISTQQTALASTAETTFVTAGGAGVFNDLTQLIITTAGSSSSTLTIRNGTAGTTVMVMNYPNSNSAPGSPLIINFDPPLPQAAANTNWTVQNSVATTTNISAIFAKNL